MTLSQYIFWRNVPGDLVLFDQRTSRYHALNRIGSEVWRRLALGTPPAVIVDSFAAEYDAPAETILESVVGFVNQALDLGLLIPSDAPVAISSMVGEIK